MNFDNEDEDLGVALNFISNRSWPSLISSRLLRFAVCGKQRSSGIFRRLRPSFVAIAAVALLPGCSLLPGSGPKSDAVNENATAGVRSQAALPYALVDVSADTIGFLSQPNVVTFQGEFS